MYILMPDGAFDRSAGQMAADARHQPRHHPGDPGHGRRLHNNRYGLPARGSLHHPVWYGPGTARRLPIVPEETKRPASFAHHRRSLLLQLVGRSDLRRKHRRRPPPQPSLHASCWLAGSRYRCAYPLFAQNDPPRVELFFKLIIVQYHRIIMPASPAEPMLPGHCQYYNTDHPLKKAGGRYLPK